jgi:hypothetical protein
MKAFIDNSKNLRFGEKMNNVMMWRKNQLKYNLRHHERLESPKNDEDVSSSKMLEMSKRVEE